MKSTGSRIRGVLDSSFEGPKTELALSEGESRASRRISELEAKIETDASMIATLRTFLEQGRVERDNLYKTQDADKAKIQILEKQVAQYLADLAVKPKEVIVEVPVKARDDTEAQLAFQTRIAAEAERRVRNMELRSQSLERDLDDARTSSRLLQVDLTQMTDKMKHVIAEKEALATQLKVQKKAVIELKERLTNMTSAAKAKTPLTRMISVGSACDIRPAPVAEAPPASADPTTLASLERLANLLVSTQAKLSSTEESLQRANSAKAQLQREVTDLMKSAVRAPTTAASTSPPPSPSIALQNLEISTLKNELAKYAIDLENQRRVNEESFLREEEAREKLRRLCDKFNVCKSDFGTQSESSRYEASIQTDERRQPLSELKVIRRLKPLLDCPVCAGPCVKSVTLLPCAHHLCERCHEIELTKDKLLQGCICPVCKLRSTYALPSKAIDKLSATVKLAEKELI